MKGCGIVLLVFAVGNLIMAFVAMGLNAPADAIGSKFSSALLLGILGGLLFYFGLKRKNNGD